MDDTNIYIRCMTKVKQRIGVVRWLVTEGPLGSDKSMLTTELVFVQFRKILELIAYSTPCANKAMYERYVISQYVTKPGDRWSRTAGTPSASVFGDEKPRTAGQLA